MNKLGFFSYSKINIYAHIVRKSGHKIKQIEWNAYFDCYLEASLETISEQQKKTASSSSSAVSHSRYPPLSELLGQMLFFFFSLTTLPPSAAPLSPAKEDYKNKNLSNILVWHLSHSLTIKMMLCLILTFRRLRWGFGYSSQKDNLGCSELYTNTCYTGLPTFQN